MVQRKQDDRERRRLLALEKLDVLDTGPEPEFDALAKAAALVCGTSISLVSLLESDRQWFKANIGLDGLSETPRDVSFCTHAIEGDDLMEVTDARRDPRFAENPFVVGDPNIRFYAGVPLTLSGGENVGTLCVIDTVPQSLSDHQKQILKHLAKAVTRALEVRRVAGQELQVEQALAGERRRLNQIIDGTGAGTWEWNVQTGENRINARWASLIGYRLEELEPITIETWEKFVHPDDIKRARTNLEAHFSGSVDQYDAEMRMRHKDGRWVWIISRGRVLTRTQDGKPEWMFGSHLDISQRKRAEADRLRSEEMLERTGRAAGIGGWELDLVTSSVIWSNETCRIHGLEPGFTPTLETAIDFYEPESRPLIARTVETAMHTGQGWDLELQLIRADGQRIWVRAIGAAQFEDGKPVRLFGTFQNIDHQVAQRIALEQTNERFTVATRNGRVGVWDADLVSGRTFYSDIWCEIIGLQPEDLNASNDLWLELIHPDDRERALNADQAHVRGDEPYFEEEFRMRHTDGRWIWILDRGLVTARDENGTPLRMIGTHTDITPQKLAEEERRIMAERMAIATDSGGIGIWEVDLANQQARWDDWMYRLYGVTHETALPIRDLWRQYAHPDDLPRLEKAIQLAMECAAPVEEEFRIIWPDGSIRHLHISARAVDEKDGVPKRLIGAAWDVTEERELAIELEEQHELLRVTLTSIGDAVITADRQGRIEWLNPIAETLTGWTAEAAKGFASDEVFRIVHERTREVARDPIRACLEAGAVVGLPEDTLLIARDGREFGVEDSAAPIRDRDGNILGAVLVFRDVTEQRKLTQEMRYRARHDLLTDLINRSEFERRIEQVYSRLQSEPSDNALLFIDLDQFKIVNDSCGHSVGDQLLKRVSALMQGLVRSGDTLARLGGDEFAVILDHCPIDVAAWIAQRFCDEIAAFRFVHEGRHFHIGASIGLVPVDASASSVTAILQAADAACYVAKEQGRNQVYIWRESDQTVVSRSGQTRWVSRIEQALEESRFILYGQKIASLKDYRICHIELLLRMRDDDGAIILPSAFMPAAERFNLVTRIDRWVLSQTLNCMTKAENRRFDCTIGFNLSGHSLGDRGFHAYALDMIERADDDIRSRLCLEITETAVITNLVEAVDFINKVRQCGVKVALDDFGAGTSSFSYLKRFTVDYLKIDGQFAQGLLAGDPLDEASIRCFVELARILNIKTIAEFVSDQTVAERLTTLGVDMIQGYLIHEPEPIETLIANRLP